MTRRSVLALGAAGGAALLAACGTSATAADPASVPDVPTRLSTLWSNRADGPMPRAGDEGVPFSVVLTGAPQQPSVQGGALVSNMPRTPGAIYVGQRVDGPLHRLGARFGFLPGDSGGALALVAFTTENPPRANLHMAFTSDRWIAGVVTDGAVDEVARGFYSAPVPLDGTPVQADVRLAGTTVWIAAPDGTVRRLDDPRFAALGTLATWEFFKLNPGSSDVRMYATWAG